MALLSKNSMFKGEAVPFVMELPNYRMPSPKNVLQLLWEKAGDFLRRAFTVIFVASIVIWFLQTFDPHLTMVADSQDSILALIAGVIAPVFAPLGFGDWRVSTALITGFMAKESVVSTLTVLFFRIPGDRNCPHTAGSGLSAGVLPAVHALCGCDCLYQTGAGRPLGAGRGGFPVCGGLDLRADRAADRNADRRDFLRKQISFLCYNYEKLFTTRYLRVFGGLSIFIRVAETLNFSEAAKKLHISHQALSRQIQILEQEAGVRLLERTTTRVSLTEVGQKLYDLYVPVLDSMHRAQAELKEFIRYKKNTLRVGYFAALSYPRIVAPLLRYIRSLLPDVSINVRAMLIDTERAALMADELDLVVSVMTDSDEWEKNGGSDPDRGRGLYPDRGKPFLERKNLCDCSGNCPGDHDRI